MLGLTLDAGVPDGAGASIVVRPLPRVRLSGGITHNAVSAGARAGINLSARRGWCSPVLSFDIGRYAEGDANPLVQKVSGDPTFSSPMLERVGYSYGNAHVGLEFGHTRATFYIHAGVSYVTGNIHGLSEAASSSMDSGGDTTVSFSSDPRFDVATVSARIGLVLYLL